MDQGGLRPGAYLRRNVLREAAERRRVRLAERESRRSGRRAPVGLAWHRVIGAALMGMACVVAVDPSYWDLPQGQPRPPEPPAVPAPQPGAFANWEPASGDPLRFAWDWVAEPGDGELQGFSIRLLDPGFHHLMEEPAGMGAEHNASPQLRAMCAEGVAGYWQVVVKTRGAEQASSPVPIPVR